MGRNADILKRARADRQTVVELERIGTNLRGLFDANHLQRYLRLEQSLSRGGSLLFRMGKLWNGTKLPRGVQPTREFRSRRMRSCRRRRRCERESLRQARGLRG